ncbi:sugar transporter [Dionaea muscipula]
MCIICICITDYVQTYIVLYSVTAELTADSGGSDPLSLSFIRLFRLESLLSYFENSLPCAGLAIGVVNLAIVVPLLVIPLGAGPWNALFGGGNIPPFSLASLCAFAAGIITTHRIPHLWGSSFEVVLCACIVIM